MKTILLTQNMTTIVDDDDFEKLSAYKWQAYFNKGAWYAGHSFRKNKKYGKVYLHRLILGAPAHLVVDHINGNGLDNRKGNLRLCTQSENTRNRAKRECVTGSRYKGVSFIKAENKWRARISLNGKAIMLGRFDFEIDAATAYDAAATQMHGEFARPNQWTARMQSAFGARP